MSFHRVEHLDLTHLHWQIVLAFQLHPLPSGIHLPTDFLAVLKKAVVFVVDLGGSSQLHPREGLRHRNAKGLHMSWKNGPGARLRWRLRSADARRVRRRRQRRGVVHGGRSRRRKLGHLLRRRHGHVQLKAAGRLYGFLFKLFLHLIFRLRRAQGLRGRQLHGWIQMRRRHGLCLWRGDVCLIHLNVRVQISGVLGANQACFATGFRGVIAKQRFLVINKHSARGTIVFELLCFGRRRCSLLLLQSLNLHHVGAGPGGSDGKLIGGRRRRCQSEQAAGTRRRR
mmetsp:Transcript_78370/g.123456  ORF Transcript_78370/g.123456 Transcript_78370/m.123456 type:complete len:283 (+) Transcript_78370:387-1235(+)